MSDESPEGENAAHDAPVDETEPAAETAAGEQPASAEPPKRSGFYVPKWVAVVVAAAVLAGGGFAVGRVSADGGGDHDRREHGFEGRFPGGPEPRGGGRGEPPRPSSGVFLGVSTRDATGGQQGAEVVNVLSGSPAAQAGLQTGDVITAVDGSAVMSASDLGQRIRSHKGGDQVTITYSRGGSSAQTQVQLGNRSAANAPAS
jgi:S1-C subfamily serine protease